MFGSLCNKCIKQFEKINKSNNSIKSSFDCSNSLSRQSLLNRLYTTTTLHKHKMTSNSHTTIPTTHTILSQHALPGPTLLSGNTLNHFNLNRKNNDILDKLLHSDNTVFIPVHELKPLVSKLNDTTYEPVYLTAKQLIQAHNNNIDIYNELQHVLIGVKESDVETEHVTVDNVHNLHAIYSLHITDKQHAESLQAINNQSYTYSDVRTLLPFVNTADASILGFSRSMLEWHKLNQYCGICSGTTVSIEGGCKRKCSNKTSCGRTLYPRVDPVIIVLTVSHDGQHVLLGRKKQFPQNMYTCIAGFCEPGESLEESAVREVYEETGITIQVNNVRYVASQPWPFLGGQLMIGMIAVADQPSHTNNNQQPKLLDGELEDAKWFDQQTVLSGLDTSNDPNIWKQAVQGRTQQQNGSDHKIDQRFKVPGRIAVAHNLIDSWANNVYSKNNNNTKNGKL